LDNSSLSLDYQVNWESDVQYSPYGLDARSAVAVTINALSTALLRYSIANNLTLATYLQVTRYQEVNINVEKGLPYRTIKANFDLSGLMCSILLPFAFSFLLPVYVYAIAYEKQEKLREMMKMVIFFALRVTNN
jgi:hypothetical protein